MQGVDLGLGRVAHRLDVGPETVVGPVVGLGHGRVVVVHRRPHRVGHHIGEGLRHQGQAQLGLAAVEQLGQHRLLVGHAGDERLQLEAHALERLLEPPEHLLPGIAAAGTRTRSSTRVGPVAFGCARPGPGAVGTIAAGRGRSDGGHGAAPNPLGVAAGGQGRDGGTARRRRRGRRRSVGLTSSGAARPAQRSAGGGDGHRPGAAGPDVGTPVEQASADDAALGARAGRRTRSHRVVTTGTDLGAELVTEPHGSNRSALPGRFRALLTPGGARATPEE